VAAPIGKSRSLYRLRSWIHQIRHRQEKESLRRSYVAEVDSPLYALCRIFHFAKSMALPSVSTHTSTLARFVKDDPNSEVLMLLWM
jgi:hypothetical protein